VISLTDRETLQHRPAGTILFNEGDAPRGVYVIHSGTMELLMRARNGGWTRIRSAAVGEMLGLESVIAHRPHDSTARATTSCDLGFIEREPLLRLLDESPGVWLNVLRLLSQDVNKSYDSLRNVAQARA
jgi:CRP-like cAMP-binding protein